MSLAKTKTKLTAALCMLLIAAVMMTTASYAWFTISTAPEITDMETTVVTNETLEIALCADDTHAEPADSTTADAGNQYTWGNIIDLSEATDWDSLSKEVRPAQLNSDGSAILYPEYAADGRISALENSLELTDMTNGYGNLVDGFENVYGYYVDFYLRSNVGGNVDLTAEAARGTNGVTGEGSWVASDDAELLDALRVAFQVEGADTITEADKAAAADGKCALTCDAITELEANTAKWIRMYVYIDGDDITNAHASLSSTDITGTINVQFAIDGVTAENAMESFTEDAQTAHD